jgi:hypothetical protein
MFMQNKYFKHYFYIINRAKSRKILPDIKTEKHHVIPRSLGGTNDPDNIVVLTAREHFICHRLLPKFTKDKSRTKMLYAIWKMCHSTKDRKDSFKLTARTYSTIKEEMRNSRTSEDFTPEWRAKISASAKGRTPWNKGILRTEEEKIKIKEGMARKRSDPNAYKQPPCSKEKAEKIKLANTGKKWVHDGKGNRLNVSPEDYDTLIRNGWLPGLGKRKVTVTKCVHCNKEVDLANFRKWHGDKCSSKC